MIVRRLVLRNWMCYRGEVALDLPAGAVAVVGEHDGDPRRSNWAGKTTLMSSIPYVFWGWSVKRLANDVISWGERECLVYLDLGVVGVERGRGRDGAFVRLVDSGGVAFSGKDAEDGITRLLRLSRDDAFASCVVRQGDMTRFVDATSAERQAIVADWLDQAAWERCEARAREEARAADAKATGLALALGTLASMDRLAAELPDPAAFDERARVAAEELQVVLRTLRLRTLSDEFDRLKERAASLRAKLAVPPVEPPSLQEQADADQALDHAKNELAEARRKRDWDGACPVDGGDCPAREQVLLRVSVLKGRDAVCKRLLTEVTRLDEVAAEIEQRKMNAARDVGVREQLCAELERVVARGRELRGVLAAGRDGLLHRDSGDTDALRRRQAELEREHATATQFAAEARGRAADRAKRAEEAARLTRERDEWAARADALWGAVEAFGRNGIQAAEAEGALADLEERGNRILRGTGLDFAFATAREGQKLESACRRCRHTYRGQKDRECPQCRTRRERQRSDVLDVLVSAEGGPRQDVAECSGGARALVGCAVRLAAASLLRSTRGSPLATLLVDEPFASLDEEHRQLVARRLGEMATIAGFEQMLVVTHDRDLADALPHRVVVRRSGGYSTAEVEA